MTVYFANPGDNLQAMINTLLPGDTLSLNDGVYLVTTANPGLNIQGVSGTSGSPITIKATHDGKAIIDGQAGAFGQFEPLFLTNSSYITIQGLITQNSYGSVNKLYGPGPGGGTVDHITLKRMTSHGTGSGNHHVFNVSFYCTNVLVEDCAAWGPGRYMFIAYRSQNVTFRRCYAYWNGLVDPILQPRACAAFYASQNCTIENMVGRHVYPDASDTISNYYTSVYQTSDDTVNYPVNNCRVLGSVFYDNWQGYWLEFDAGGSNTLYKDCYFEIPLTTSSYTTKPQGEGFRSSGNAYPHTITNCTFRNCVIGLNRTGTLGPLTLINSVFTGNTQAVGNDPGHTYCDFWHNESDATFTLYGSAGLDATLTTALDFADKLTQDVSANGSTTNGTPSSGWIQAHGGTLQTPVASIPATPDGKGFILPDTTLEGQTIQAGSWSATWTTAPLGSMANQSFDTTMRFFKRSSGGTFTSIGTLSLTSQTWGAAGVHTILTFPTTTMAATSFGVGDRLYMDLWLSASWGASGNGFNQYLSSSSQAGIDNDFQVNTPGYLPTGVSSLSVYGSATADATVTTAADMASTAGGTETSNAASSNGTPTSGWIQAHGGTLQTPQASIPVNPDGKGFLFQSTLLEGSTLQAGNWSAIWTASTTTRAGAAFSATMRFFVRSVSGNYTSIGSIAITSQTFGSSGVHTQYTFPATSMAATPFGVGDRLYVDLWVNATWGASGNGFAQYLCNSVTAGVANDFQVSTPGYSATALLPLLTYASNNTSGTYTPAAVVSVSTTQTDTSNPNTTSGTPTSGWIEAHGGTLQAPVGSVPDTPTGKGWIYQASTLDGKTLKNGNWSATWTASTTTISGTTFSALLRIFKVSGGIYTPIGSITITNQTFGSSGVHTQYTFPSTTFGQMTLATGDRVYVDLWVNAAWGAASNGFAQWLSASRTTGVSGDLQVSTPGYFSTVGLTDYMVDPGYDTDTYGRGGALFIPATSPIKGKASDGSDIGANILYQYVDGVLTTNALWPLPIESRVVAELGISPTYEAMGGLWRTLNGVYGSTDVVSPLSSPVQPVANVPPSKLTVYPIDLPPSPYAMNGTHLETQPHLRTAPASSGTVLPAGSSFLLLFTNPSSATQTALANGTRGTMDFALYGGQSVSGPVQITSSLSGSVFHVIITTQAIIQLKQ